MKIQTGFYKSKQEINSFKPWQMKRCFFPLLVEVRVLALSVNVSSWKEEEQYFPLKKPILQITKKGKVGGFHVRFQ
jgi:hypothetical protein